MPTDASSKTEYDPIPYTAEFFDKMSREAESSADVIVPIIQELIGPKSVVDVGCGTGGWLATFKSHGVERVCGMDGDWVDQANLLIEANEFLATDLSKPWSVNGAFDLAVCLEVAEHLPRRSSSLLVSKLVGAAPCVLFSAALPGQGGTGHINEQWPEYWKGLFAKHEYVRLDAIRPLIWLDDRVAWYYKQNLYLFAQRQVVATNGVMQATMARTSRCPLTLVHPKVLAPMKRPMPAVTSAIRVSTAFAGRYLARMLGIR